MSSQEIPNTEDGQAENQHGNLLLQAKQNQKKHLQESKQLSQQLHRTLASLIRSNSTNGSGCPPVLDKITTIHQLDKEIDRQLKEDVSVNYENLIDNNQELKNIIYRSCKKLNIHKQDDSTRRENYVDMLQRRSELIDQDLRILENTLKLVELNNQSKK